MLWLPSFNSLWWRWGWYPYIDTHINKNAHTHTPSIQLICHGVSCFYCPFSSHSCDQCNLSDGPSNPYKPINQTTLRNETQKIQEGAKQRSSSDPPPPPVCIFMLQKTAADGKRQEIIVLDSKRSNAINIGLTVLPPPRTIKTAILNFDEYALNKEGIEVRDSNNGKKEREW